MIRQARPTLVMILSLAGASRALADGPNLTGLYPAGSSRGQAVTVTASGTFGRWPVQGWVEGSGVEIEAGPEKGKLTVRVADDARPGLRWLRLHDEEGATALRPFFVGTLPEVVEAEPNDGPTRPQVVALPSATVNGRLAVRGDVDGFSVSLRKGETLTADLEANRRLGSPMDAVLQVVSASGSVLAQNDDTVGRDPRIHFDAPADGSYIVRLFAFPSTPDSTIRFAGGDAFIYRLTLTTRGYLDHAFPLAVPREGPSTVAAIGPNIPEAARLLPVPGGDGHGPRIVWHPLLAGTAEVHPVAGPLAVEAESDDPARPQVIPDGGTIGGRIDPPGDRDIYRLSLKKGDKRTLRVESRALGLPLDPVLKVLDAQGRILAEDDDAGRGGRDPELTFIAPADGDYRLLVRDLNDRGGPRFAYILRAIAPDPDFSLSLAADRFDATPGKPTPLIVTVERKFGFSDAIEVVAEDLPGGLSATSAQSKPGDASAKTVTLTLTADACSHPGPFRVAGKSTGSPSPRYARAPIVGFEAKTDRPWLTIRPQAGPGKP